jgi:hypothetical protein
MQMIGAVRFPFIFAYAFVILFNILGFSFLSGVAIIVLAIFINVTMGIRLKGYRNKLMKSKD